MYLQWPGVEPQPSVLNLGCDNRWKGQSGVASPLHHFVPPVVEVNWAAACYKGDAEGDGLHALQGMGNAKAGEGELVSGQVFGIGRMGDQLTFIMRL